MVNFQLKVARFWFVLSLGLIAFGIKVTAMSYYNGLQSLALVTAIVTVLLTYMAVSLIDEIEFYRRMRGLDAKQQRT